MQLYISVADISATIKKPPPVHVFFPTTEGFNPTKKVATVDSKTKKNILANSKSSERLYSMFSNSLLLFCWECRYFQFFLLRMGLS